jgi:hypothetical protein
MSKLSREEFSEDDMQDGVRDSEVKEKVVIQL